MPPPGSPSNANEQLVAWMVTWSHCPHTHHMSTTHLNISLGRTATCQAGAAEEELYLRGQGNRHLQGVLAQGYSMCTLF